MNINELNKEQLNIFIHDYYNSEDSIKKILQKYNINQISTQKIIDILPNIESGSICQYCNTKMIYSQKSRTAYKENFKCSDEICSNCNHKIVHSFFGRKICTCDNCLESQEKINIKKNNLKVDLLIKTIKKTEEQAITIDELKYLSLSEKTNLLTLLMYLYDENNHSFKSIDSLDGIKFAPTTKYGFSIINELLQYPLIKLKNTQNTINGITFNENGSYSYTPYMNEYQLNIVNSHLLDFSDIVKNCEYIYSDDIQETKREALDLWKKIGFQELKEYTYYLFEKYNFDTKYIGDAIIEKLELILEDFSISQGYAILYSSVTGAASYKQTGIAHKHAVNSINTYIANNIAKRKSKEWETKGYKRNFDLPQTAISMIFFNNILKIGDKGFEQVPKISTLNDNFIRHIDEINFNETHYSNKIEYEIGFELLNTLSTLIQEQYSFGEIIDLLNSEFTKENKIMKQLDDFEILEKLKKLKK